MSAIASHSPLVRGPLVRQVAFAGTGGRILDTIRAWRARMRQRSELAILNGAELRELSLTEADVNRESCRPFWKNIDIDDR